MTQVAVAAGVCLVAVLGVQSFNSKNEASNLPEAPVLQTLPFNNAVQEVSYNAPSKDTLTSDQLEKKVVALAQCCKTMNCNVVCTLMLAVK